MRIVRIQVANFRCIKTARFFPEAQNVLLAPNNSGKTAILEALNLLLSPESANRFQAIDENDFYKREYVSYQPTTDAAPPTDDATSESGAGVNRAPDADPRRQIDPDSSKWPRIRIEAVLSDLDPGDEDMFRDHILPWDETKKETVEASEEGVDPFAGARVAVRVVGEGWYDADEDDFRFETYFLRAETDTREESDRFTREHKRQIGFLIYRDLRALARPVTLEPTQLFARLLQSQGVVPREFEEVLRRLEGDLAPMTFEPNFLAVLNAYKAEIEQFLLLSDEDASHLSFEFSERTRKDLKVEAQLYVRDGIALPLQKQGAGTRSLATLAMLSLIMRRRGRGILALEEPETFLFPHAQRRVVDECVKLATQTFITTHSPYVLERVPVEGVVRISRDGDGTVNWRAIGSSTAKKVNLYSRYLRKSFCEALLGRCVVVVEGESDRWWLNAASRILHGKTVNGRAHTAFELHGVAVVSADANSDIAKFGRFFGDAGLTAIGVADKLPLTEPVVDQLCSAGFPVLFLPVNGIEDVLAEQFSIQLVRKVLEEAPHSKTSLPSTSALAGMTDAVMRTTLCQLLINNKGSASMHEWIASLLDENSLPSLLCMIVDLVDRFSAGETLASLSMRML